MLNRGPPAEGGMRKATGRSRDLAQLGVADFCNELVFNSIFGKSKPNPPLVIVDET